MKAYLFLVTSTDFEFDFCHRRPGIIMLLWQSVSVHTVHCVTFVVLSLFNLANTFSVSVSDTPPTRGPRIPRIASGGSDIIRAPCDSVKIHCMLPASAATDKAVTPRGEGEGQS